MPSTTARWSVRWLALWQARALPLWFARYVLLPCATTRLALLLVGFLGHEFVRGPSNKKAGDVSSKVWISIWNHWDSWWYLSIVHNGYSYKPDSFTTTAFWPLYPWLIKAASLLTGAATNESWALLGIVLSNLLLLVGLGYLAALVRLDFDPATAGRTVLYLLVFPTSLFLSAVYPESLFLLLSAAAFYYARRQSWWLTGVLAGLATLSRPLGVLLVVPLGVEYLLQRGVRPRALLRPALLAFGLAPAAFLGWAYYLYLLSGNPFLVHDAHAAWRQHLSNPISTLWANLQHAPMLRGPQHPLLDLLFVLLLLVLAAAAWRLTRPSYALFASLFLLMVISRGSLVSVIRYALELFPLFLVLALAGRNVVFHQLYVAVGLALASLFMVMFALGYWVA